MSKIDARWEAKKEKFTRRYANHLALTTRKRGNVISLYWRYGDHRKIGEYRTWSAVHRALKKLRPMILRETTKPQARRDQQGVSNVALRYK